MKTRFSVIIPIVLVAGAIGWQKPLLSSKPPIEGSAPPSIQSTIAIKTGGPATTVVPKIKNAPVEARRTFTPTSEPLPWTCHPGTIDTGFIIANRKRTFRIHIPAAATGGQNLPLLMVLHGTSGTSAGMEFITKANVLADREGFIVVYPQGLGDPTHWNIDPTDENNEDPEYFERLFFEVFGHCPVDQSRVYVTGLSNGGGMTHRLACNFSKMITAIAPVGGAYGFPNICSIERPVPVIAFHGMADPIVLYDGNGSSDVLDQAEGAWPSLPYWAHGWAMRDFCLSRPVTSVPAAGILIDTWSGCRDGAEVVLYSFENGGHTWPGGPPFTEDMGPAIPFPDATRTMWEFFKRFSIPTE